jgi:LPS-assembly lipoprotein
MRRAFIQGLIGLAAAGLLAGCGFQLRGQAQLPFVAAYVDAGSGSTVADALRQELRVQGKLADKMEGAPVRIRLVKESREKSILSLSGGGKVREYRIEYRVELYVSDPAGNDLIAPAPIHLTREYSYNDTQVLAKESEEAGLDRAMDREATHQILRRLSYLKR